jgi:hypothetical protein
MVVGLGDNDARVQEFQRGRDGERILDLIPSQL